MTHLAHLATLSRHVAANGWSLPGHERHSDSASRNTSSALAMRAHATSAIMPVVRISNIEYRMSNIECRMSNVMSNVMLNVMSNVGCHLYWSKGAVAMVRATAGTLSVDVRTAKEW